MSLSREQVRAVDRWAIEQLGLPGLVLMENAGRNAADAAGLLLMEHPDARVAVLAGAGNNGGDGLVVARHLSLRGLAVDVYLRAQREKVQGDALVNLRVIEALGLPIHRCHDWPAERLIEAWRPYGLLIDALGGTGIQGPLRGPLAEAVQAANETGVPILAIDIPTGLDCDTGLAEAPAIRAVSTITFVARKVGFDNPQSRQFTGEVVVADIGVPALAPQGSGGVLPGQ